MSLTINTLIPHVTTLIFQSRSRHARQSAFALCVGLALGAGCDPQAPTDYWGEQLLSIRGHVETEPGVNTEGLQPALAFYVHDRAELRVMDVEVQGEFPNRFQLDVYDPPPADSLLRTGAKPTDGEPEYVALGYVTAMPAKHPSYVPLVSSSTETTPSGAVECDSDGKNCHPLGGEPEETTVMHESCAGVGDEQRCYSQTLLCPSQDAPPEQCQEISHEGDPSIAKLPWSGFAGVSENFLIMYFDKPAPAGSQVGLALGIRGALSAGYHLFEVRKATAEEQAEMEACAERAEQLAADRYNQTHGTSETPESLGTFTCGGELCDSSKQLEFDDLVVKTNQELACTKNEQVFTPVENPAEYPISVRLGRHPELVFLK